ncbi:DUF397 domain-containing protein [Streptomyces uncialis]|uniref:DUF397 domain-containing protein n=1 Tax=Streptomyces uncialis TaxID=1048205 RepID=UPI003805E9F5
MRSSHSGPNGGDCIEIAPGIPGYVPIGDTKVPHAPALMVTHTAWSTFISGVKDGDFTT